MTDQLNDTDAMEFKPPRPYFIGAGRLAGDGSPCIWHGRVADVAGDWITIEVYAPVTGKPVRRLTLPIEEFTQNCEVFARKDDFKACWDQLVKTAFALHELESGATVN